LINSIWQFGFNPYLCRHYSSKEVFSVMLIIDSKDCENIDKALKKYKKKFEKSKTLLQLRERQTFTKPSIVRRGQVLKAIYKQQLASGKFES
jgi:small subunit ribosomal protein S21